MDSKAKIRKVKPYPIETTLNAGSATVKIKIVKLTKYGFLAETADYIAQVQEHAAAEFRLPALNDLIKADVQVIKTYDSVPTAAGEKSVRLAEFHFINLEPVYTAKIDRFLRLIKQVVS